jgi:predicted metal-dependent HD superfamily phosphohydrolase
MHTHPLHDRWNDLCKRVGAFKTADESDLTFEMLSTFYAHPPRAYHNLEHIAQCLKMFDEVRLLANDRDLVEFALYLHDCVYYPLRPDNEERSAEAAAMIAGLLGCRAEFVAGVRECIMVTRHSNPPGRGDTALVADIDLSILGSSRASYDEYRRCIREEFAFADDAMFVEGRGAFVQRMLDKDTIFATPQFKRTHEFVARDNLYRELDDLAKGIATPLIPPTE